MHGTPHEDDGQARYRDFSKRWILLANEGGTCGQKPIVLRSASFRQFYDSAKRLSRKDLLRALRSLWCHPERETEQFATLLLYFYLFIHLRRGRTGFRELWTKSPQQRAWAFFSNLWTLRARLRRRYREFVTELTKAAEHTPPTNPPVTAWMISCTNQLTREGKRRHLVGVLRHYGIRPPGDEPRVLGCWAAARELLKLALDDRSSVQVRRALAFYKRFISGRHANFVGRGILSKLVRQDLFDLCAQYPEYLAIENNDRDFLENWFLARFSVLSALKVAFPRRFRTARSLLVGTVTLTVTVGICDFLGWQYGEIGLAGDWHYHFSALPFAVAIGFFASSPSVFRLLYPRLFAGAVFGWTSILAGIGSEVLFTSETERIDLGSAMLAMPLSAPIVILLVAVVLLPLFFLYQDAYSAIGVWKVAVARALLAFFFLLVIVVIVGLVFVVGVDEMLCGGASCLELHRVLLIVGCAISTYFAMITQLVWTDKGISSTLAGRGYADDFEE